MRIRRTAVTACVTLAIAAAAALAIVGTSPAASTKKAASLTTVNMVQDWPTPWVGWIPWVVADAKGYFAQQGIKLAIRVPPTAADPIKFISAGRADVAYRLLLRDNYPSWLYPVQHGATTIWERWNGWTHADGFFNPHMNSFNHYSLGSVGEWLFRHVAGIEVDPDKPGFQHFILRPFIAEGLTHASANYRTMHGEIASAWKREGENFTWTIRIPANCTAQVHIPGAPTAKTLPAGRYDFSTTL